MFLSIIEQSCVFLPLVLGIYISYGVLRIADLTTDGTFVLGAALFAIFIELGLNPLVAISFSILGGMLAGLIVSLLQTRLHLQPLIAGILLVFILNTLTLKVMGKPNISLFDRPSIFFSCPKLTILIPMGVFLLLSGAGLLASRLGLMLHAFGNHPTLLHLCGKNGNGYRTFGLSLSNGLVACSGALTAQVNGYADIGMGVGMILIALGIVIIGQQIYSRLFQRLPLPILLRLICCFLASVLYFSTVYMLLALGLDPIYLRLMIGISLIAFLGMTQEKFTQRVAL
jgi:putative ABC transport system permease protein